MKLERWTSTNGKTEHHYFVGSDTYIVGFNPDMLSMAAQRTILDLVLFDLEPGNVTEHGNSLITRSRRQNRAAGEGRPGLRSGSRHNNKLRRPPVRRRKNPRSKRRTKKVNS